MSLKGIITAILALLSVAHSARACLWDYDTLRDEKRGLPGMAEILAGQWERHSRFFYQHRVAAMRAKLAVHPDDWDAMDNLAVAHCKLDDLDAAITVMLDKEKRHPGQYTTASNLGTFYMFNGDLPAAIDQLKKALAINPNAHFGREEYQLRLAEFLLKAREKPFLNAYDFLRVGIPDKWWDDMVAQATTRPITAGPDSDAFAVELTSHYRDGNRGRPNTEILSRFKPNVFDGVVGMIRFGTNRSPELYYALGDLLAADGKNALAYRAYQRAIDTGHPRPAAVKAAMRQVRQMVVPRASFDPAVISSEHAAADRWVTDFQQFEDGLVRDGKDTDDEANYALFYASHPRTLKVPDFFWSDFWQLYQVPIIGSCAIALLVTVAIRRHCRRGAKRRSFRLI